MTLKENRTKKIAQVKEVEDLRKNGIRVEAACIKVGIHKSNYYAYKAKYKNETHGACDKVKVFSSRGVLSYVRKDTKGKLDLNMIEMIPHSFNQLGGIDWEKASRLSLEKKLESI